MASRDAVVVHCHRSHSSAKYHDKIDIVILSFHEIYHDAVIVLSTYHGFTIIPNYRPALTVTSIKTLEFSITLTVGTTVD